MRMMASQVLEGLKACDIEQLEDYADCVLQSVSTALHLRRDTHAAVELFESWLRVERANERAERRMEVGVR
jgi:hypothetical protein